MRQQSGAWFSNGTFAGSHVNTMGNVVQILAKASSGYCQVAGVMVAFRQNVREVENREEKDNSR
jgi:hypothetical protein